MFDVVLNCTEGFLVREELENCFSLPNVAKTLFRSTRTKPSQHNAVETFSFRSFSFVESIIRDRFQCLGRYISRRLKVYFIDELRQHL